VLCSVDSSGGVGGLEEAVALVLPDGRLAKACLRLQVGQCHVTKAALLKSTAETVRVGIRVRVRKSRIVLDFSKASRRMSHNKRLR